MELRSSGLVSGALPAAHLTSPSTCFKGGDKCRSGPPGHLASWRLLASAPCFPRVLPVYAQGHKTRPPASLGPEMILTTSFSSLIKFNPSRLLSPPDCKHQPWPQSFIPRPSSSSYASLWKLIKGQVWAEAAPCQAGHTACEL